MALTVRGGDDFDDSTFDRLVAISVFPDCVDADVFSLYYISFLVSEIVTRDVSTRGTQL